MDTSADPKGWFITGCSRGFGRCLVQAALAQGQHVVATARDPRSLSDLVGPRCTALTLDVTSADSVAAVIREAHVVLGRLDVVVNCAGYGLLGAVEECSEAQVRHNLETNFFGPLAIIRAALPILRQQRSGHIVNFGAAAALTNYPGFGVYGGAKAALELMSESLSAELRPLGIRVTVVQPGPFRTDFITHGLEKAGQSIADYAPTAGKFASYLTALEGRQPGDPRKAAELVVQTILTGDAPLRLPLGKYMIKKMRDKSASLLREAEKWETAASNTDGP